MRAPRGPSRFVAACGLALGLAVAAADANALTESLTFFLDVSSIRADSEVPVPPAGAGSVQSVDLVRETVRQEYSLNWRKPVWPYLTLGASFRYFKFDLDSESAPVRLDPALGSWREEIQPAGEIAWSHPYFKFTTSAFHRKATASFTTLEGDTTVIEPEPVRDTNTLTTDDVLVTLSTVDQRYPLLGLRYEWRSFEDRISAVDRETQDQRLQATADYTAGNHRFDYSYTRRLTENVISGLEITESNHLFRWNGFGMPLESRRMRLSGNYTFSRAARTNEILTGGTILEPVPVVAGLYLEDPSPDADPLDVVPGLTDGNTETPTQPPIDIGSTNVNQNVGVDLGFTRPVSALYLYTDRLSGPLSWRLYSSLDNFFWDLETSNPEVSFNAGLNRYEILFPEVRARYVKVVNGGINAVAQVFVTEIQAFQGLSESDETTQVFTTHLADGRMSYDFTEKLDTSMDVSYQQQPAQAGIGRRDNLDYSIRGRYHQARPLTHLLKWSQSFQEFSDDLPDVMEYTGSYTLLLDPLETLNGSMSLTSRHSFLDSFKEQEFNSAVLLVNGTPVTDLDLGMEVRVSRDDRWPLGRRSDVWSYRVSSDVALTRSLDVSFSWRYQSVDTNLGVDRIRRFYTFGVDWRVTRTIFARSFASITDDVVYSSRQDYLLGWNLFPKLTLGAQAILFRTGSERTWRYNVNANYELSQRINLYSNLTFFDFTQAAGNKTTSWQLGVRAVL